MGLAYLNGKSWDELTREERFYCAQLYFLARERGVENLVVYLNEKHDMTLDPSANWEIGYEVCFYRDFQHAHRKGLGSLPGKRTFDLCLMSDRMIVIIEAKAQQGFETDQLEKFQKDPQRIRRLVPDIEVILIGLCSSHYLENQSPQDILFAHGFAGTLLTWKELAAFYADPVLARADTLYESPERVYRKHSEQLMSGENIVALADKVEGSVFWVGRSGGLNGKAFLKDTQLGRWRTQMYETNRSNPTQPSSNWFSLQEFLRRIMVNEE